MAEKVWGWAKSHKISPFRLIMALTNSGWLTPPSGKHVLIKHDGLPPSTLLLLIISAVPCHLCTYIRLFLVDWWFISFQHTRLQLLGQNEYINSVMVECWLPHHTNSLKGSSADAAFNSTHKNVDFQCDFFLSCPDVVFPFSVQCLYCLAAKMFEIFWNGLQFSSALVKKKKIKKVDQPKKKQFLWVVNNECR